MNDVFEKEKEKNTTEGFEVGLGFRGGRLSHPLIVNPGAVAACVFGALATIGLAASGITAVCAMGAMGIPIATTCATSAAVLTKKNNGPGETNF
ncbi:hypothetical protein LguiA_017915 [Lonicera macranthoides]